LAKVNRIILEIEKNDPEKGGEMLQACDQISELLRDLAGRIEDYSRRVELDEQEFMELEARLSAIQTLKRRYGPSLDNVLENLESARQRLELFSNAEKRRQEFDAEEQLLRNKLRKSAEKLSAARKQSAAAFRQKVIAKLKLLGFMRSALDISFTETEPGEKGMDRIDFMFSANPGEELQPLRNIASSGEISRVMLALKTVLADADSLPILVFDEIDVNIGGETANQVGIELKALGQKHQVLCISHLAQVAAQSDAHYRVQKEVVGNRTCSRIACLDDAARVKELGRMLGGSQAAIAHAKELIAIVSS
jgi:DNA repair protein RecN (Recombination protein N)